MGPLTVRAPGAVVRILAAGCLAGGLLATIQARPGDVPQTARGPSDDASLQLQAAALLQGKVPVVAEHRYRIAGKIRPLLFWFGKDNIGSARVRWRRGEGGDRGYDLLIGSDPARAPRKTNRWGFLMEESSGGGATILGVMKRGEEASLAEAEKNAQREGEAGPVFNMIRATVGPSESVAHVTSANVKRDYSYRELDALMERLVGETAAPQTRKVAVPAGGRFGLLLSLAELLHDGVESVRSGSKAPGRRSLTYAYYRKQYDLSRVSSEIETNGSYGGATYPRLLKAAFEIRARGEPWTESFSVVCGIDGPLAEVPVFMTYQPRWWFKLELVLDEQQAF